MADRKAKAAETAENTGETLTQLRDYGWLVPATLRPMNEQEFIDAIVTRKIEDGTDAEASLFHDHSRRIIRSTITDDKLHELWDAYRTTHHV